MSSEAVETYNRTTLTDEMIQLAEKTGAKTGRRIAKQTKKLTGRPTSLTPLVALRVVEMICEGNRPRVACAAVGITKRTFDTWKSRAKEWTENEAWTGDLETVPPHERIFVEFSLMIDAAEGEAERAMLKKALSGKRGWQAAVQVLERRFASGWSKESVTRHEISGGERPVVIEVSTDQERSPAVASVLANAGVIDGEATEIVHEKAELKAGEPGGD